MSKEQSPHFQQLENPQPDKVKLFILSFLPYLLRAEADELFQNFQKELKPRLIENNDGKIDFEGTDAEREIASEMIKTYNQIRDISALDKEKNLFDHNELMEFMANAYAEFLLNSSSSNPKLLADFLTIISNKILWIPMSGEQTFILDDQVFYDDFIPNYNISQKENSKFVMTKFQALLFWKMIQTQVQKQILSDQKPIDLTVSSDLNQDEIETKLNEFLQHYGTVLDSFTLDLLLDIKLKLENTPPNNPLADQEAKSVPEWLEGWRAIIIKIIEELDDLDSDLKIVIDPVAKLYRLLGHECPDTDKFILSRAQHRNLLCEIKDSQDDMIKRIRETHDEFFKEN